MATKFVLKQNLPSRPAASNPPIAEHVFEGSIMTVGSDAANNLVVPNSAPEHFVVVREGENLTLINGAEGTLFNGQTLRREAMQPLAGGDRISVGDYVIAVEDDATHFAGEQSSSRELADEFFNPPANSTSTAIETKENFISQTAQAVGGNGHQTPRNFADILDALRTEEDSFYFSVKNGERDIGRIALEQPELPIGVDAKGEIVADVERISSVYALVRKDWSGILLESQKRGAVFVNGEALETVRRLRNDDRVSFASPSKFALVLHEPTSLVALESLLSARADSGAARFGNLKPADAPAEKANEAARQKIPLLERRFFGYFNFTEMISMGIATLIGAVLIFLFLEFMFS